MPDDTRPPRRKSDTRQRTKLTQIRLTPDEATVLEARREAGGFQTVADMIRVRCLYRRPLRARLDVVAVLKVSDAVNRIGHNVNQIAARANESGRVLPTQLAEVRDALAAIYGLVEGLYPDHMQLGSARQKKKAQQEGTP